ncbi:MAG: hypothetical protein J5I93_06570 [Pirellulaceae bacterium]|nr:hypothetical protein [Pirellulaceae bacterium]
MVSAYRLADAAAESTEISTLATALVAWTEAVNAAMVTQQIAKAAADELYQLSMAGPIEAYRIATAQAGRDHRVALATAAVNLAGGGSQQNHADAVSTADAGKQAAQRQASSDYGTDEMAASGARRIAAADADLLFAQQRGDADVDWATAAAGAYETYLIAEATAHAARVNQIAAAIADSATTEADTYASAMQSLATAAPSPWATLESDQAAARRDRVAAEVAASVAREGQSSAAQQDFELAQAAALVQFLIDQTEAERDLADAIAQAERDRTGSESQAASDLASTGNYAGELPAALEVNTTRLEVRDASTEDYQKWVSYFANGPQAESSFSAPLPQSRLGGTQLVGSNFRQGDPNAGGQSEIYDHAAQVCPCGAENGDAADSTISVLGRVLHYTSPLAWLFITADEWEMGVEQVHGGWIRFAWRTRDRLAGRQVDDAVEGAGAFAGGIAAASRYLKLAELHLELHRGTAGAHGITALAQPGLNGRQRRALEAVLDYSLPATAGEDADGPLLTDMVRERSLRLSPMDAQDGMQTAPLADAIVDAVSSEAIPGGILAGALQARRIGNVGLRRAVANAGQVPEGIAGAPARVAANRGLLSSEFSQNVRTYLNTIENHTGFRLHPAQRARLIDDLRTNSYSRLTSEAGRQHRRGFTQTVRRNQIAEWERQTGQTWPRYAEDLVNENGTVLRRAGDPYDAHHVIESIYSGPHEWWNLTPARFPNQHQGGVHLESIMDVLFP